MKSKFNKALYAGLCLTFGALPFSALAQAIPERDPEAEAVPLNLNNAYSALNTLFTFIYSIFFGVAAFFLLWAAFTYLQAGGSPEKAEEGKKRLVYAIVGITIAFLALGIDNLIQSILQGGF